MGDNNTMSKMKVESAVYVVRYDEGRNTTSFFTLKAAREFAKKVASQLKESARIYKLLEVHNADH
jgi:hypothetical protein